MDLKHALTVKYLALLSLAIQDHGEAVFDNLGPAEAMDLTEIVDELGKLHAYEAAVIIMQIAHTPDCEHRCEKLARVLAHRLRDWDELLKHPDITSLLYH